MGINYDEIRERLMELKKSKNMDNYEFCKIYAPEKCDSSKSNAENYISALSTGRNYPTEKHGPLLPDLEHLQNIVDSELFPDVTLDYLVYGKKEPAKVVNKIDFDLSHWTHADICELLWALKTRYPEFITIEEKCERPIEGRALDEYRVYYRKDVPVKRTVIINIEETNEYEAPEPRSFSIGQAIALFHNDMIDSEDNRDPEIREFALRKAINRIRDDTSNNNPYLQDIGNCDNGSPFIVFYGE